MSALPHIDFISEYCDRWCARCAFTDRCSSFAIATAIDLIGDPERAIELAVEQVLDADGPPKVLDRPWLHAFDNAAPTAEEMREFSRQKGARDARVEATMIMQVAHAYVMLAHRWLRAEREAMRARTRAEDVWEALEIVSWDHVLIAAKLHRALGGRDCQEHGDGFEDHPVQTDFNGSAKVALISIERSEDAWRVIATCAAGQTPTVLADQLAALRQEVEAEFPRARSFVRPGFDELVP
jgi:hypothetical protein